MMRAQVLSVIAAVSLGLTGCDSGDEAGTNNPSAAKEREASTTTRPRRTTTTAEPIDASAAWEALRREFSPAANVSHVVDVDAVPTAVTAEVDTVIVWSFDGSSWGREASVPTELGAASPDLASILADDFTGDGAPDFLVPLEGNPLAGLILTSHNGSWIPALFETPNGRDTFIFDLEQQGRDLISYFNDCMPSCADGTVTEAVWRFVPTAS